MSTAQTFDISDSQVTIGVIGDANSGKSTLQNALLRESLLPAAATSCTSILTHVTLADSTPLLRTDHREVRGANEVRQEIGRLNDAVRAGPGAGRVADVGVCSAPRESLEALADRTVKLIDVPGHNETLNLSAQDCFRIVARLSDVMVVVIKYDAINTESTKRVLELLESNAPHVLAPTESSSKLIFVISQCDGVWTGLDEDGRDGLQLVEDLKASFRRFLRKHRFPCAESAPVAAVSALNVIEGGAALDWRELEAFLLETHKNRSALRSEVKLLRAQAIVDVMQHELAAAAETYPERAQRVLQEKAQGELENEEGKRRFWRNVAICTAGTALTLGGGWMAAAAWGTRAAALASYSTAAGSWFTSSAAVASAASAVTAAEVAVLGGSVVGVAGGAIAVASGVNAVGAAEANDQVNFSASSEDILNGKAYEDTLLSSGKVLYVGNFLGSKPHGRGRMFWPNEAQSEAVIGDFDDGRLVKGFLLDELEVVVGHFQVIDGKVEAVGWQPEDQFADPRPCAECAEAVSMASVKKALAPCNHGSICMSCAESLLRSESPVCPVCGEHVSKIVRLA